MNTHLHFGATMIAGEAPSTGCRGGLGLVGILGSSAGVRFDRLLSVAALGDLDLAGLGSLRQGDRDHEHTVVIAGVDVLGIETIAEEQLPEELAVGALGGDDLVA